MSYYLFFIVEERSVKIEYETFIHVCSIPKKANYDYF